MARRGSRANKGDSAPEEKPAGKPAPAPAESKQPEPTPEPVKEELEPIDDESVMRALRNAVGSPRFKRSLDQRLDKDKAAAVAKVIQTEKEIDAAFADKPESDTAETKAADEEAVEVKAEAAAEKEAEAKEEKPAEKKEEKPAAPPPPAYSLPAAPEGKMTLRVNDKDHFIDPKKYRSLIEALHDLGYDIPHFCYHPGLEADGNCRMCYVNLIDMRSGNPMMGPDLSKQPFAMGPKPIISCRQPLDPRGMAVLTETESVIESRKYVMEFMLINHPLDCFVCDKAGECMLQDNSFDHGPADSRFKEHKNEIPKKELGPTIDLWTDRCITCRRCTRFLEEVSGTSELYIVNRGDRSEIDIMPGFPVDNDMMGNIVDICPVGALIDKDLKFSYRAWYLQKTDTIYPGDEAGVNIQVETLKQYVRRITPRENREVNGWWIHDSARKDFDYINSDERVMQAQVDDTSWPVAQAAAEAGKRMKAQAEAEAGSVAGLFSPWMTIEEMAQFKQLMDALGADTYGMIALPAGEEKEFPKYKIYADKNPNKRGADLVFGAQDWETRTKEVYSAAQSGKLKALYVVSPMPRFTPSSDLLEALDKVELVVVQDLLRGALTAKANIVLPASSFAEKDGVFVNVDQRAQVVRRAIDPLGQGNDDLMVLQRVLKGAGEDVKLASARVVFHELVQSGAYPALAGLSHKVLGRQGKVLEGSAATAAD